MLSNTHILSIKTRIALILGMQEVNRLNLIYSYVD